MKPMSKKVQMICTLPAVIVGGAVMVYCFATNMPGNKPLIYGIVAMIGVWLLMYLFRIVLGEDQVLFTLFGFRVTGYMFNKTLATLLVMIFNYFAKRWILRGKQANQ